MNNSFYNPEELAKLPFKALGKNILISRFARFYGIENIEIGNNVRIDDFCILTGTIILGSHIHISAFCALYGRFGIEIMDYSGLSPRCTLFSASDDFSGDHLIGPMVEPSLTNVIGGRIIIEKYCQLGSHCVVLPDLRIHEGVTVGAMSLINKNLERWKIYKGIPATFFKERSKKLLRFIK